MNEGRARVRKIVLANAWSEKTKGDLGIMCGTIEMLRALYPQAEITALRMLGDHRPEADLVTLQRLYGVRQVSSCLPIRLLDGSSELSGSDRRNRLNTLRQGLVLLEDLGALALAKLLRRRAAKLLLDRALRETIEVLAEADLVVTKGGGFLNSPSLYADFQLLLPSTLTWWLAYELGRPLAILGQSVWSLYGPLSHCILRPLVTSSLVTTCREPESLQHLLAAGYPEDKVRLAPCPSFAMQRLPEERGREIIEAEGLAREGRPLVGVSIRYHGFGGDPAHKKLRQYLQAVAETVKELYRRYGALAVVVPQNIAPGLLLYNDQALNELFADMVGDSQIVRLVATEYTPHELVAMYSQFQVFIGTRLHACVFALRGYTPVVPIAYAPHKTTGVMSMLGLADYVMDIARLTAAELTERTVYVWQNRERLAGQIRQALQQVEKDVWNNVLWTDEELAHRQGSRAPGAEARQGLEGEEVLRS